MVRPPRWLINLAMLYSEMQKESFEPAAPAN